jgi:hypothetical protein
MMIYEKRLKHKWAIEPYLNFFSFTLFIILFKFHITVAISNDIDVKYFYMHPKLQNAGFILKQKTHIK